MPKPGELIDLPKGLRLPRKKEKPPKPKNAVIYVRYSDPRQGEKGDTAADQESACRKYCQENGYTVLQVFIDGGKSGYKTGVRRPGLDAMLDFCKKNASIVSVVVLVKPRIFCELS